MAVTLLDNQIAASTSASTSITVTLSAAPTAGDILVAFVGHSDDFPSAPAGWTQVTQSVQTGVIRAFTRTATGSDGTSFNFTTPSPGGFIARILRYTGLDGLDSVGGPASSGTNQILFGTTITTAPDTLILASGILHGNSLPTSDMTWSNSFVPVVADITTSGTGKQTQLGLASRTVSSAGSYTTVASYTPTSATGVEGVIVAFAISAPTAGNAYFRRSGAWVHATAVRKVRVAGVWDDIDV